MNRSIAFASILFVGLSLAPVGGHVVADEQPFSGYSAASSRTERQWEEKLRAIPTTDNLRSYMQRLSARPHNVGSPYDKDNAEWLAAKFKEFGLDTHIEQFDVLYPTPKERVVELVEGGPKFVAKLQEPALPQDPTSESAIRAAAHLQRLFHRWRRHRAARLRQLRHPGRLRAARSPGHFRQGQDRHRPLLPFLARHQAESRRRARRRRLPHLFRPARRWLRPGRNISRRTISPARRCAARQRRRHALLSRRSSHSRSRRHERRQAPENRRRRHDHENSRAPDFLRRRATACSPRSPARSLRKAGAAASPSPTTSARAPRKCI